MPDEWEKYVKSNKYVSKLPNNRILLAQGKVANIYLLGGHPPETMDLSMSLQLLLIENKYKNSTRIAEGSIKMVPYEFEQEIADIILKSKGLKLNQ
jgi:S-adenosylhomocysteine hydrolase